MTIEPAPATASRTVTLTLSATSATGAPITSMRLWDAATATGWVASGATVSWQLPAGEGVKTIRAQFRDREGNISPAVQAQTILDQTAPSLALDPLPTSSERSPLLLKWTGSNDLSGLAKITLWYRLDEGPEAVLAELEGSDAAVTAFTVFVGRDTQVSFRVQAIDQAGNVGEPSAPAATFTDLSLRLMPLGRGRWAGWRAAGRLGIIPAMMTAPSASGARPTFRDDRYPCFPSAALSSSTSSRLC